jgi:hypothetical protein
MRYPKAVETATGTLVDGIGDRTEVDVVVFVGEESDGTATLKIEIDDDGREETIEARLDDSQVAEIRDALGELVDE